MFSASWRSIIKGGREVQEAYIKVVFTNDAKQNKELDVRSGKASAVMRALYRSVVLKLKLSKKTKLSKTKSMIVLIVIYGYVVLCNGQKIAAIKASSELRCLQKNQTSYNT